MKKSKKLSEQNAPPSLFPQLPKPPHGAELWGAESLQSPLTGPPARGSSNALLLQFLYI